MWILVKNNWLRIIFWWGTVMFMYESFWAVTTTVGAWLMRIASIGLLILGVKESGRDLWPFKEGR